jgi:hypothetical protein
VLMKWPTVYIIKDLQDSLLFPLIWWNKMENYTSAHTAWNDANKQKTNAIMKDF